MNKLWRMISKQASWRVILSVLLCSVLIGGGWAQRGALASPATHTVVAGDTARSLAELHLGDGSLAAALLHFNGLDPEERLTIGQELTLPLEELRRNDELLEAAQSRIAEAREELAHEAASTVFQEAEKVLREGLARRAAGDFDRSTFDFKTAAYEAGKAREVARMLLREPRPASINGVYGVVEHRGESTGQEWRRSKAGGLLEIGGHLRTGPASQALVKTAEQSVFKVHKSSEVRLVHFVINERTGQVNSRLELVSGEVSAVVTPTAHGRSTFDIEGPDSSIAIRGTKLRVHQMPDRMAVSLYEGRLTVFQGHGPALEIVDAEGYAYLDDIPPQRRADVKEGQGAVLMKNGAIRIIPKLPDALEPLGNFGAAPFGAMEITARFNPPAGVAYTVEIATDPGFRNLVQESDAVEGPEFRSEPLRPGSYHLRTTATDPDGVIGEPSRGFPFEVEPNYEYETVLLGPAIAKPGDLWVVGPGTVLTARPMQADNGIQEFWAAVGDGDSAPIGDGIGEFPAGTTEIRVHVLDALDRIQAVQTFKVQLDDTAPLIETRTRTIREPRGDALEFSVTATDDTQLDSIGVRLNGGPIQPYRTPLVIRDLDRNNEVVVRAEDALGNAVEQRFGLQRRE